MEIAVMLGICLLIAGIGVVVILSDAAKKKFNDGKTALLLSRTEFDGGYELEGTSRDLQPSGLVLSKTGDQILLISTAPDGTPKAQALKSTSLLEIELVEDGNTLEKTSRGSQVVGMAVGGAILGGAGAIVGGLSGSKSQELQVKSLSLRIFTDDLESPMHEVYLYRGPAISKSSREYVIASTNAHTWIARLRAAVSSHREPPK